MYIHMYVYIYIYIHWLFHVLNLKGHLLLRFCIAHDFRTNVPSLDFLNDVSCMSS